MKRVFFMLLATLTLVACDKGGGDTPKPIELTGDTQTTQTIYADETKKPEGIKFKATAAWSAAVTDVTSKANDEESWLRLNAYSGDAGDISLTISLDQNDTGKDRKAEIRISCDGTTITIIVEQKATTQSGGIPVAKLITKIERVNDRTSGGRGSQVTEFLYDNLDRVNKIVITENEIEGEGNTEKTTTWILTSIITYGSNTVSYDCTQTKNGVPYRHGEGKGEITLDNNGRAISGKGSYLKGDVQIEETKFSYSLEYNTDGYLSESKKVNSSDVNKFTWVNNNLTQVWWGVEISDNKELIDRAIYGNVLNKANLDLNWFFETGLPETEGFAFACGDSQNIFPFLGYMGKRAKNLVEQLSDGYKHPNDFTIKFSYVVDADGYPTMIEQSKRIDSGSSSEWQKQSPYKVTYNK